VADFISKNNFKYPKINNLKKLIMASETKRIPLNMEEVIASAKIIPTALLYLPVMLIRNLAGLRRSTKR
jgi:hypothetical protein